MSKNNLPGEAFSDRENAETYEQLDLSELIYGLPMGEADFMLNEAQEIQYNEMCQECRQECKQLSLSGSGMPEIQSEKKQEEEVSLQT